MTVRAGGPSASPHARPVDISADRNARDADLSARFHPDAAHALDRAPEGPQVFRGLPFALGSRTPGPRWVLADREITIRLARPAGDGGAGASGGLATGSPSAERSAATHVVVAHACDCWRDPEGRRPAGMPPGWVLPVGEPLARYEVILADGSIRAVTVRRRIEIDDAIVGWGSVAFAAVDHRADGPLDWRGPHARQAAGRYAAAGHAGPLTILPGTWAAGQSGVTDHVPDPEGDASLWLHAIALGGRETPVALRVVPLGGGRPGTDVVIAAITLFDGIADPMAVGPRRSLLVTGAAGELPEVDLGTAIRVRRPEREPGDPGSVPLGWGGVGSDRAGEDDGVGEGPGPVLVDVAVAPDAHLRFGRWDVPAADLADGPLASPDGSVTIVALPQPTVRVAVAVTSQGSGPVPAARVRFVSADGRYLPPLGHRDEINPGLAEDTGADVLLAGRAYAYVPGEFAIDLPPGPVDVEVVRGFDHRPVRTMLTVTPETRDLVVDLPRPIDLRPLGWMTADAHVHFLAPSTALLQAAAEDLGLVHLLATQWGDHMTGVADLPWGSMVDPTGAHAVVMGTENRQNMLGHIGLLGARRPVLPMASGGGPEGRIGQPVTELLADWADRCHADGGLAVASHFPLPYAEVAADIVAGRIDAVEMQCFAPGLDSPSILEWYRFLSCGHRVPVLGGTDRMSAEVPVGAVRTYARLRDGEPPSFAAWSAAVRAGRTFATSGPVLEIDVDGRGPGELLEMPASGGRLTVHARARAAQAVIGAVEVVVNGRVVGGAEAPGPARGTDELAVDVPVEIRAGSWIAARSRSPYEIRSAFATSMAAHTSPVYVDVRDRPIFAAADAVEILAVIDGTLRWLRDMATVESEEDRLRMVRRIDESAAAIRRRLAAHARGGRPT